MTRRSNLSLDAVTGGVTAVPLMLLFALNAVDELDRVAFGVLLPEIRDWFGVSLTAALTLQTIAGILTIFAAVPVGYFADRVNRVRLTAAAAFLWGVMCFLTGLAPSLLVLGIARLGSGIAKTTNPAHSSLLADYYPQEARTGVFSVFGAATSVGGFFGPIIAGYVAGALTWQVPFLLFATPSLVIGAFILLKLREPARGVQERAALGLTGDDDPGEAAPPSVGESWRIAKGVRTLRRIWWALPFLAGATLGLSGILSLFYDEVFHLSAGTRGTVVAAAEPFRLAGLLLGAVAGNRFLSIRPSRLITYVGLMGVAQGLSLVFVAISPWWWLSIVPFYLGSFAGSILGPALFSLITVVIPPRIRGFSLGASSFVLAPGLLLGPIIGQIGDRFGLRWGVAATVPVFVLGSLIIATAGASVDGDIRQARAAAAAQSAVLAVGEDAARKLLVARDLDVHLGGVQILFGVDLDVEDGEILALLGTNGAGKSTLLRALAGTVTPSNGAVFLGGEDITFLPASAHAERGIAQVQGGRGVFPTLTVAENIRLAEWGMKAAPEDVEAALDLFPILRERADQPAGNLSGGEQQMLALAQAFLAKPRLLVIDELSLGLAPAIVEQLLEVVRAIHAGGATVILVEQSINIAFTIARRAVFMEKGEVRFTGPTAELLDRPDILRAVFLAGGSSGAAGSYGSRARAHAIEERKVALEVKDLHKSFGGIGATNGVSFTLEEGRILGMIGPNGAGKTTLYDLISGFLLPDAGEVWLEGQEITYLGPDQRARLGLHRSFQDARLFPALTVTEAIQLSLDRKLEVRNPILGALHLPQVRKAERKVQLRTDRLIELLGLGPFRDKFLRDLSTGSRRLVDLAAVVATEPKVLLLDEPSAGVAQKETEEMGPLLERIRHEVGCAILLIEHDMPLISAVSDELLALEQGRVVTRGLPDDVLNHPQVIAAYLGTSEAAIARSAPLP
jgi:ABC-type branched-subunit amino acid transport system ATPase component/predicted MFS family arabinose efflux permease